MQNIYFIDIETVPGTEHLIDGLFPLYFKRFSHLMGDVTTNEHYEKNAGMFAEFGKVISVSIGFLTGDEFRVKTITGVHEMPILEKLAEVLSKVKTLAGHNIKEFDVPYLMRRYIINKLPVPAILQVLDKKPWEIPFYDTMEMWGSTQWKYRISLDLLATVLGIASPKQTLSGDQVGPLYYSIFGDPDTMFEKETEVLKKIGDYNAGDVVTNAKVFARMKGHEDIIDEQVKFF